MIKRKNPIKLPLDMELEVVSWSPPISQELGLFARTSSFWRSFLYLQRVKEAIRTGTYSEQNELFVSLLLNVECLLKPDAASHLHGWIQFLNDCRKDMLLDTDIRMLVLALLLKIDKTGSKHHRKRLREEFEFLLETNLQLRHFEKAYCFSLAWLMRQESQHHSDFECNIEDWLGRAGYHPGKINLMIAVLLKRYSIREIIDALVEVAKLNDCIVVLQILSVLCKQVELTESDWLKLADFQDRASKENWFSAHFSFKHLLLVKKIFPHFLANHSSLRLIFSNNDNDRLSVWRELLKSQRLRFDLLEFLLKQFESQENLQIVTDELLLHHSTYLNQESAKIKLLYQFLLRCSAAKRTEVVTQVWQKFVIERATFQGWFPAIFSIKSLFEWLNRSVYVEHVEASYKKLLEAPEHMLSENIFLNFCAIAQSDENCQYAYEKCKLLPDAVFLILDGSQLIAIVELAIKMKDKTFLKKLLELNFANALRIEEPVSHLSMEVVLIILPHLDSQTMQVWLRSFIQRFSYRRKDLDLIYDGNKRSALDKILQHLKTATPDFYKFYTRKIKELILQHASSTVWDNADEFSDVKSALLGLVQLLPDDERYACMHKMKRTPMFSTTEISDWLNTPFVNNEFSLQRRGGNT